MVRARSRRAIKTSPKIVAQARARISKPKIRKQRRKTSGFSQSGKIRTGGFVTSRSRTIINRAGQTRKAGKQITSATRTRQIASSITPKRQAPVRVKAPIARVSSSPKPSPQIFNPIANIVTFVQETSRKNAVEKRRLKEEGLLPAQQPKRQPLIDDIFGGFLS